MLERLGKWLRTYAEKDGRGYPDWAIRYAPIVRRLRGRNLRAARILEIGANESGFARFARVKTVAMDIAIDHLRAARAAQDVVPVAADIAALPFRDGSIDVCVCVDTFEHTSAEDRETAMTELARILRDSGTAVVAFPAGEAATHAELAIAAEYAALTGRRLHWLDEHAAKGLPDADAVAARLAALFENTHRVTTRPNATLWVWKWMWRVLLCGWPGRGNAAFQAALRLATPLLCRIHLGRCYRTVIWIEPFFLFGEKERSKEKPIGFL